MEPILQLQNVTKCFDGQTAVDDFSLEVTAGDFLSLLGPSGCGKTTVLRLIAGFENADSGNIMLNAQRINDLSPNQRSINTVFQSYALFPHMNVAQNVGFSLKMRGVAARETRERVAEVLEIVNLEDFGKRRIQALSGGQQQRVALARALVAEPLVLLLDEPFSALDYRLRKKMQLELKRLHRKVGITFIFVTHDQEEAIAMSNQVVVMNNGRIEQQGPPRRIYEEPANLFVARFVGETNIFDATVLQAGTPFMTADVEGLEMKLANGNGFQNGDKVRVVLRPEDMTLYATSVAPQAPLFSGQVEDLTYKGTTYDLIVRLESGKTVLVTEFFNEDAENVAYQVGDNVRLGWYEGWEVVLGDD